MKRVSLLEDEHSRDEVREMRLFFSFIRVFILACVQLACFGPLLNNPLCAQKDAPGQTRHRVQSIASNTLCVGVRGDSVNRLFFPFLSFHI